MAMVGKVTVTAALTVAAVGLPAALDAQDATRPRILVPYFTPAEGVSDRFGKETSKEFREIINGSHPIYDAITEDEIKDELERFDLKIEDLGCLQARQLASQIRAALTLCAEYTQDPGKNNTFTATFWDMSTSESLEISPLTVGEKEYERAAQHIISEFDVYVELKRSEGICIQYQQSGQWENALRQCDNALRLNPNSNSIRYRRARILMEMQRLEEALEELVTVIDENQLHDEALQSAGYVATMLADTQEDRLVARSYYERYLELNPASAQVRMNIAYELATAGDPVGAMDLIQAGLDIDAENLTLWEQFGNFAFAGAEQARSSSQDDGLSPEVADYYRKAIEAYTRVYEGKGAETSVSQLRNVIAGHLQLGEPEAAVALAGRVTGSHGDEPALWSIYADGLQRLDRIDEAVAALDQVKRLDPEYPNLGLRQGQLLLGAGRLEEAVTLLTEAIEDGHAAPDAAGNVLYGDGVTNGYQKGDWDYAVARFTAAKGLEGISSGLDSQLDFLHGFCLFKAAEERQAPNTVATARATLPLFRQVIALMNGAGEYARTNNQSSQVAEVSAAATQYIDIQEAIIRRGGGDP